jgi:dihydrofolate synthase/folylpolyglutamate synthase
MALTYDEAIQFITSTPSAKKVLFSGGEGMERAKHFFKLLGDPQETFRSVHIAGTSGKGTVAYMIESLLRHSGRSTGLTLSPHVYDIRERCIVNGELLPKEKFASAVKELIEPSLKMDHTLDGRPTYFETTNAIAFKQFAKEKVDYGIIETGLGGQYDSTNTISRTDKLAVITKLGLDHTEILGSTVGEIASQKAGILPLGGDAIVWKPEGSEALNVIESVAKERGAKLQLADKSLYTIDDNNPNGMTITYHDGMRTIENIVLPPGAEHQAENATLAIKSVLFLAGRDGFTIQDSMIRNGMKAVNLPGRLEHRRLFDRDVIFDGAHNPQKIAALLQSLEPRARKPIFVLALKKTKDADEILRLIAPHAASIITSQFFTDQDGSMTNLSFTAVELARMAEDCGIEAMAYEDSLQAVRAACNQSDRDQQVVVTGSFYFLGELSAKLPLTLES